MSQRQPSGGGYPVLVLLALSIALSWVFGNPYLGFVVIFAAGLLVLGLVEWVRRWFRPVDPDGPPETH